MARAKGLPKTGGRAKGTPNSVTAKFKDAVQIVYEEIGSHAAFADWARANPGDFYKICSKMITAQSIRDDAGQYAGGVTIVIGDVAKPNWAERTGDA
jgi:hypothetical protein